MRLDATAKSALPDLHLAMGRSRHLQVTSLLGGLALVVLYYRQQPGNKVGQHKYKWEYTSALHSETRAAILVKSL